MPQPDSSDPRYRRSRLATVDTALLISARTEGSLLCNLFDDVTLEIVFDEIISRGRAGHSFLGRVAGESVSTVLFEQIDEVVIGAIQTPGGHYVLRFAGNGLHSIHEVRPAAPTLQDDFINVPFSERGLPATFASTKAKKTFNYLGLYTKDALTAQGSKTALKATVRATVTWLQAALKAQKLKHKVKFKGIKAVKGSDSRDLTTALTTVTDGSDGIYDTADKLRNKKGADFVGLYIRGDGTGFGFCGLGWRPFGYAPSNEAFAYHSVREDCNAQSGGSVGAHETLHNMGGCHPNVAGDGCFNGATPNGKGHAFQSISGNFHTTLGTGAVCGTCVTLRTVSGKKKFQGSKVTDANSDISGMVNRGAATYAGYR